jgi:hypothetical protein
LGNSGGDDWAVFCDFPRVLPGLAQVRVRWAKCAIS